MSALKAQTFVQLAHQNQAAVGSHSRALELDPQGAVERELKGLLLRITHCPPTSTPPQPHPNPHPSGLCSHFINLIVHLENGNPG
jgi:hypothetical protein